MRKIMIALALLLFGSLPLAAQGVSPAQMFGCNKAGIWTANATPLAVSKAGQQIYICGFAAIAGTAASAVTIQSAATGGSCGTPAAVIPVINMAIGISVVDHQSYYPGLPAIATGSDLCATVTGTAAFVIVYYTQF